MPMFLIWDPTTGKYRSVVVESLPTPTNEPPPIWPKTPAWYPKDDHWRGGER